MKKSLLLLTLLPSLATAQDIQWEKSYGGRQAEYLFDAIPTADYGFILAGSSLSKKSGNKTAEANGDLDFWIWKMDENGQEDWQKSFGGIGSDLLVSIKNTNDGGFILGGTSNSPKDFNKKEESRGGNDYWIIKLNAKGIEEWQRTFGGDGQDDLQSVTPTKDGGYIVGGTSGSDNTGDKNDKSNGNLDYWIIKLDSKGTQQWQKSFGGQYADVLRSIVPTNDGGYIIGGASNSSESNSKAFGNYGEGSDYWILKLDDKGETQWQQTFGGDKDDQLSAIQQTFDKGYIIGGYSVSSSTGNKSKTNRNGTDFWIVKIEENGQMAWQETYDFGKVDILTSLIENDDHSFLIGGYAQTENFKDSEGINDYIALKISERGEKLWDRTVGSEGTDVLRRVIETRDGGYIMAGTSNPIPNQNDGKVKSGNVVKDNLSRENLNSTDKLNQEVSGNIENATQETNAYYKKQTEMVSEGLDKIAGQNNDGPLHTNVALPEDPFNTKGSGGNTLDKLENSMPQSGPKPGLAASRDKKLNLGNNDFWVVKLKDKEKKVKEPKTIEAFPNPAQQFTNVIIGFDYTKGNIAVYDINGQQLQNYKVTDRTIPVDLGNYPEGIYIVKVATDKGDSSIKIIKGINKN